MNQPVLSILVCTMPSRYAMWGKLQTEFWRQALPYAGQIELLFDNRISVSIGGKRNDLLNRAKGKYVCFHDDDDWPEPCYIEKLMTAAETDCDCASLKGIITWDGKNPEIFEHSLKYKEWKTNPIGSAVRYERYNNHLNCIRASIAKQFKFPDANWSEDKNWSDQIYESGLIKTEHYIPEVIYNYRFIQQKNVKMLYSQGEEESFIIDFYKDKPTGKFIDIGAYDVFRFSNTRRLYENGWRGLLIEPAPKNYKAIADHYAGNDKVTVLNIAIGDVSGEIDFYESDGDAVGTTDEAHMKKWGAAGVKYEKIKVQQVSVVDFMNEYGKDVDFLSIDTESTNMIVFRNIPDWVWEQISMLCIEHDQHQEEIEEKLSKFGFVTLYINAENIILSKN